MFLCGKATDSKTKYLYDLVQHGFDNQANKVEAKQK